MKIKKLMAFALAMSMCAMMMGCSEKTEPATAPQQSDEVTEEPPVSVPVEDFTDDTASDVEALTNPCLMGGEYIFKDYTYITNEYDETDGSYYDEYVSDDGVQAVYEKGVMSYNTDVAIEDAMLEEAVKLAKDAGVSDVSIEEASYSSDLGYPAYVAKFYSGSNEDTRSWIVYIVNTDPGLLMYALSCAADYEDDMLYDAEDVFPKLTVEDNYRGLLSDETGFEEVVDLMSFLGGNVDEACLMIPGLEAEGDCYGAKEEKAMDGLALAGPFFYVDAEGTINTITYSGQLYCIESLWVGTSMADSGEYLKDLGWEFKEVGFANGTAAYVVTYTKDDMELILVSDEAGDFDKSEESDVTGCIDTISVSYE